MGRKNPPAQPKKYAASSLANRAPSKATHIAPESPIVDLAFSKKRYTASISARLADSSEMDSVLTDSGQRLR